MDVDINENFTFLLILPLYFVTHNKRTCYVRLNEQKNPRVIYDFIAVKTVTTMKSVLINRLHYAYVQHGTVGGMNVYLTCKKRK